MGKNSNKTEDKPDITIENFNYSIDDNNIISIKGPKIEHPEYLWRIVNFNKNTIDALTENYIWASSIHSFNDPLELENPIFKKFNDIFLNKIYTILNTTEKEKDELNQIFDKDSHLIVKKKLIEYKNFIGVVSFSDISQNQANYSEMLMWAHYGNSHKGIAIKYNTKNLLNSFFFNDFGRVPILSCLNYINYDLWLNSKIKENPNKLNPILLNSINTLIKSDIWKYENEWRLVFQLKGEKRKKKYNAKVSGKNTVEEITFGRYYFRDIIKNVLFEERKIIFHINSGYSDIPCYSHELPNPLRIINFFNFIIDNEIKTSVILSYMDLDYKNKKRTITPVKYNFTLHKGNKKNQYNIKPSNDYFEKYKNHPNALEMFYKNLITGISIIT